MLKEFKKCKQILVSCHPRYWEDGEVNGVEDISFVDAKGQGEPQMPCAEKIKDNHTSCIHSDHWAWRPIIDVETGQIKNWNKQVSAFIHYKVCDEFNCLFTDEKGFIITQYEGYVPPFMYPKQNGWGDYIIMDIDELGYIQHWDETLVHKFVNDLLNKK
jgi:hypothetical protein